MKIFQTSLTVRYMQGEQEAGRHTHTNFYHSEIATDEEVLQYEEENFIPYYLEGCLSVWTYGTVEVVSHTVKTEYSIAYLLDDFVKEKRREKDNETE